jgi:adenine C2-methylase RlmN of 23S rRNA A2503 and tRNA A37
MKAMKSINIIGKSKLNLKNELLKTNPTIANSFKLNQIYDWIYQRGVSSFDAMTNLSQLERNELKENYSCAYEGKLKVCEQSKQDEKTEKFLFSFPNPKNLNLNSNFKNDNEIESVYIYHPPPSSSSKSSSSESSKSL